MVRLVMFNRNSIQLDEYKTSLFLVLFFPPILGKNRRTSV